jgi:ribose transport system ATP-binding protein
MRSPELEEQVLLQIRGIRKTFPGVQALKGVDFTVNAGEVHVLVGENGAGKSTLIKIITGAYTRDEGDMVFKGRPVSFHTPQEAFAAGIGAIYQEFRLIPGLSVAENLFLGHVADFVHFGMVDRGSMYRRAREVMDRLGLSIDPRARVVELSLAEQQLVEICKAISVHSDLLIMDEPTSALSDSEIEDLFGVVRQLKANGVSVIYISHRLNEVFEIGDRLTVLRNGQRVATKQLSETNMTELIRLMVGHEITDMYPKVQTKVGEVVLEARGLCDKKVLKDISFNLRRGEVLGITGLLGSGTRELAHALFGANPIRKGSLLVCGQRLEAKSPHQAIEAGIGLLPEDRKREGLVLNMSVRDNVTLASLPKIVHGGFVNRRQQQQLTDSYVDSLAISTPTIEQKAKFLSGGNQQKVVVAKWKCRGLDILIFNEPTRGIDVGAKLEVYQLMNQLVQDGAAVIIISSELPEVLGMSDRILVLHEGSIAGELQRNEANQERVLHLAIRGVPICS